MHSNINLKGAHEMIINAYNADEMQELSRKINIIVPLLKDCSTGLIPSRDIIKEGYYLQAVYKGGTFHRCRVLRDGLPALTLIGIGIAICGTNRLYLNEKNQIMNLFYTGKSTELYFGIQNWWDTVKSSTIEIPKYNYNAFEEQMFQLSCTDDMYMILRLYMEMQMNFRSNLYIDTSTFEFEDVFVDGIL